MKIRMHIILLSVLAIVGCSSDVESQPQPQPPVQPDPEPVMTTIYLIRHAEKADGSADPNLSAAGLERANHWAVILADTAFDAIYSTNYNRTRQTIQPTATSNEKEVTLYNPANFSLSNVITAHLGKNVLIVGHSNTIPQHINSILGTAAYPNMAESDFGNLYKITVTDGVISHNMTVHN